MAPVKRTTATAQRETRSTRSAAVAKKNATIAEKGTVSPLAKPSSKTTGNATGTRITKKTTRARVEEPEAEIDQISAKQTQSTRPLRGKTTKSVPAKSMATQLTGTQTLGAGPRRRIKVTPLAGPEEATGQEETTSTRSTSKESATTKTSTTRSRKIAGEASKISEQVASDAVEDAAAPKTRSTRKTASRTAEDAEPKDAAAPSRGRGRPKKATPKDGAEPRVVVVDPTPTTRATRSHRAGSTATQASVVAEPADELPPSKTVTGIRKKVTFQDLPEDDKENQPLPVSKSKTLGMQKALAKSATTSTGLRAKPVRKAATAAVTKAKKATALSKSRDETSVSEKQTRSVPRALTPKKITQVAKAPIVGDMDETMSDDEDELNGGKTPVRDLSMSPRRPQSVSLAQAMSPSKRLVFDQTLAPVSPSKSPASTQQLEQGGATTLASPARRPPASPFKDVLKHSPRRGMGESTKLLFPSHSRENAEVSASIAMNPANVSNAAQHMNTLLQSPKRSAILDPNFFSQSAMKPSSLKSPFKSSLLASPAKRLFSPFKKSTSSALKISSFSTEDDVFDDDLASLAEEITVSSHFRASVSPVRVQRVEVDGLAVDFDDSVLQIGSPMKVRKSPNKFHRPTSSLIEQTLPPTLLPASASPYVMADLGTETVPEASADGPSINPSQLEKDSASDAESGEHTSTKPEEEASDVSMSLHGDENEVQDKAAENVGFSRVLPRSITDTETNIVEHHRNEQESSEDELAADETPLQSLRKPRANRAYPGVRESLGVSSIAAGKGYGFTPLAAQMSGWLASSPHKTPKSRMSNIQRQGSFEFTPVARQHIDGEVLISRDSTPVQKLDSRTSVGLLSGTKGRTPTSIRRSLLQRQSQGESVGDISLISETLVPAAQFEEYMEMREASAASDLRMEESFTLENDNANAAFEEIMHVQHAEQTGVVPDDDDTILVQEDPVQGSSIELTTDLINFTHASDTAMIDFQKLADEADGLAGANRPSGLMPPSEEKVEPSVKSEAVALPATSEEELSTDDEHVEFDHCSITDGGSNDFVEQYPLPGMAPSPELQPTAIYADSPSMLVIGPAGSQSSSPGPQNEAVEITMPSKGLSTPVRPNLNLGRSRMINTVVSKIPLKPEGEISPIKIHKKRARSFGNSDDLPAKRLSLGSLKQIVSAQADGPSQSPDRQLRTSVAPSPGGTSTPASRYGRQSIGGMSTVTTPGQTSFVVDDFGDSTLDGIELPDDSMLDGVPDMRNNDSSPAMSEKTFGLASMMATPRAQHQKTPATSKGSVRRVTAPASVTTTPATVKKTPQRNSTNTATERTPLQPVGTGVLSGATVYVDVHTSEGADASGIFIELLTQMGAKCVKEWRWNSRASLAGRADREVAEPSIGITHVVYKDGGKRTLEKVRDARGEVWCVGVAWVLDCERESKWLDESSYAVDISLAPRGGSRRRKSMEPRALLVGHDGSVSAGKPRRSVSAEMSELMKRELVNTPARGKDVVRTAARDVEDDDEEFEPEEMATPTGFISYDPRTAMTPGTPYLVGQGKNLVQMSAPPKQTGKRLFEDDDNENENEDVFGDDGARGLDTGKSVSDAKKFRMKNLDMKSRRRTLGFKPIVGSPLSRA